MSSHLLISEMGGNAQYGNHTRLGHADVNTTHGYVEIDLKMKRKALGTCLAPQTMTADRRSKWQKPDLLKWLDELTKVSENYVQ